MTQAIWKKENLNKRSILFILFTVIFVIVLVWDLIVHCLTGLPSFDGAMNYQVPISLIRNGTYSTTYDGELFDTRIQTNAPFLLPIYPVFRLFGIGSGKALSVNAIYLLLMLVFVAFICYQMKITNWLILFLLITIGITPGFSSNAWGGYGEIPSLTWLLASIFFLIRNEEKKDNKFFIISGVCYGLACLTKVVILIALPAFLIVFFCKIFIEKKTEIKKGILWISSFILPIILFEIYKMKELGITPYLNLTKKLLHDVGSQAGTTGGFYDTSGIVQKFLVHYKNFCSSFNISEYVFLPLLAAAFFIWIYQVVKKRNFSYFNIIVVTAFSYFGWWLLITPTEKAWVRRIIIGVVLFEIVLFHFLDILITYFVSKDRYREFNNIFGTIFAVYLLAIQIQATRSLNFIEKNETIQVAQYIKSVSKTDEDAVFYGFDWWQAPVLSFLSGVDFYDLLKQDAIAENSYLVVDFWVKNLNQSEVDLLLEKYHAIEMISRQNNTIYKISLPDK
jgi:hypothetical protein